MGFSKGFHSQSSTTYIAGEDLLKYDNKTQEIRGANPLRYSRKLFWSDFRGTSSVLGT
jgi:hypothetical protein